jgi:hypothetical protein
MWTKSIMTLPFFLEIKKSLKGNQKALMSNIMQRKLTIGREWKKEEL